MNLLLHVLQWMWISIESVHMANVHIYQNGWGKCI